MICVGACLDVLSVIRCIEDIVEASTKTTPFSPWDLLNLTEDYESLVESSNDLFISYRDIR